MPWSVSKSRRRKAFEDGRRAAITNAPCLMLNATLRKLWAKGKRLQLSGRLPDVVLPRRKRVAAKKPARRPAYGQRPTFTRGYRSHSRR